MKMSHTELYFAIENWMTFICLGLLVIAGIIYLSIFIWDKVTHNRYKTIEDDIEEKTRPHKKRKRNKKVNPSTDSDDKK